MQPRHATALNIVAKSRNAQHVELMSLNQSDDDLGARGFNGLEVDGEISLPCAAGRMWVLLARRERDAERAFESFVRNNCDLYRVALARSFLAYLLSPLSCVARSCPLDTAICGDERRARSSRPA